MQILVVAATSFEIQPILLRDDIQILVTGVGIASTVYALTKVLQNHRYDMIIQAGVGGSFDAKLAIGEVVAIKNDLFADAGAWEHGQLRSLFDLQLSDPVKQPFTQGKLLNPHLNSFPLALPAVDAVTSGLVTDQQALIALAREKYDPLIESMEGAAFQYVCLMEKIPFVQIRSVSNLVGERNKAHWNLPLAIAQLNKSIVELVNAIKSSRI